MKNILVLTFALLYVLFIPDAHCAEIVKDITPAHLRSADNTGLYKIKVVYGKRITTRGIVRSYKLYIPLKDPSLSPPPYPVAVLVHGFCRSSNQQRYNGEFFAQRGFIVFTPDVSRLMWVDKNRMHNVDDVVDDIAWLGKQSKTPGSMLEGLVDPERVAIAGHSSGGAICLEAVLEAQKANVPIHTYCSLDSVPWERTIDRMSQIKPIDALSLRSDPARCNEHSRILRFMQKMTFPFEDVLIKGSAHCDGENPSNILCFCVCGQSKEKFRSLYQLLMYLYFRDSLKAPQMTVPGKSFTEVVQELQHDGTVTETTFVPDRPINVSIDRTHVDSHEFKYNN